MNMALNHFDMLNQIYIDHIDKNIVEVNLLNKHLDLNNLVDESSRSQNVWKIFWNRVRGFFSKSILNETTIEKIEEYAYREQLILIQNKDYPDKFFKHKLLKVPYAKRVNGKWVDMDPPRVIWLDKDGKEIKRI